MLMSSGSWTRAFHTVISRSASGRASGLRRVELTTLKMVEFAPMPRASVMMATNTNPGLRRQVLRAYRTSVSNWSIPTGSSASGDQGKRRASVDGDEGGLHRAFSLEIAEGTPTGLSVYGTAPSHRRATARLQVTRSKGRKVEGRDRQRSSS